MQNRKVLISLIIPCKNSELNIKKTLSSLETQNSTFEVIFVYTESSDKTLSILRNFQNKFIKKKIIKKNCGISEALNIGVKFSEGKFIMWIGSDDIITNNFIYKIKKTLKKKKESKWIITKTKVLSNKKFLKNIIEKYKFYKLKKLTFNDLLTENPISAPGVIFSKKFISEVGDFNSKYLFNSDYDMWLRMYHKEKPLIINILSTYYNRHPKSLSSKYFVKQFNEQFLVSNRYKEKNSLKKLLHLIKIFVIIVIYKIFQY